MVLKILLVITILLQIIAATIAIRMTKKTKYNSAWILFAIALTLMVARLIAEFINMVGRDLVLPKDFMVWVSVITSLCFVVGLFYVRKIIYYISQIEEKRRLTQKRILNTIISTEEKERRRFSKDLHDGLGPLLSSAKLSISALKSNNRSSGQEAILENATFVIEEAIKSLKEISNNLSPHILNNFGIARALSAFINSLSLPGGLKINFTTGIKGTRYSANLEAIVYRTVCELVNNAIKHSSATLVTITIEDNNGQLSIVVSDNGKGFDTEDIETGTKQGMGLYNISSRITSIKGDIDIKSIEGIGTTVKIKINEFSD